MFFYDLVWKENAVSYSGTQLINLYIYIYIYIYIAS